MRVLHEKTSIEPFYPFKSIISMKEEGFPAHWHQEIEVIYMLEGELKIELTNLSYHLKARDILLISSCDIHQYLPNPLGNKKLILQFGKAVFESYSESVFNKKFIDPLLKPCEMNDTQECSTLHQVMEQNLLAIYNELSEKSEGYELIVKARINDFAAAIIRKVPMEAYSMEERTKRLQQLERLDEVLQFVEKSYDTEIILKDAAGISGYSIYHFSRFFKEAMGMSFIEYLNGYRIKKAMMYLKNKSDPITEIAFKTGFNSIETFNRIFKKINGCSPTNYRNKI